MPSKEPTATPLVDHADAALKVEFSISASRYTYKIPVLINNPECLAEHGPLCGMDCWRTNGKCITMLLHEVTM